MHTPPVARTISARVAAALIVAGLAGISFSGDLGLRETEPTVTPGGVIRWPGSGVQDCRIGDRSWSPRDNACWFPVDLHVEPGTLTVERTRNGTIESTSVTVAAYPYPTQSLSVPQPMVDPPEDQLDRIRAENRRIRGMWFLGGQSDFELPLGPPLSPLPHARSFGSRRVFNGKPSNPHSGADFSANTGTPVIAAASGTVMIADAHYYAGNSVFIDHGDDLITMYFHLDQIDVNEGQEVSRGQAIGTVGATGRVTGPHLHFGVRWHGARIDPSVLLQDPESLPVIDEP
jgi:hypothetical protein